MAWIAEVGRNEPGPDAGARGSNASSKREVESQPNDGAAVGGLNCVGLPYDRENGTDQCASD